MCVCQCILRAASGSKFSSTLSSQPARQQEEQEHEQNHHHYNHNHNHNHKGKHNTNANNHNHNHNQRENGRIAFTCLHVVFFFPLPSPLHFSSVPFLLTYLSCSPSQVYISQLDKFVSFLNQLGYTKPRMKMQPEPQSLHH